MSVSEFAALMHTVGEVESTAKLRITIRSRMISMHDLPLSRTMKAKMAKAGIGLQQLKSVFSTNESKGLMALLAMPAKEKVLTTERGEIGKMGKIVAFFEGNAKYCAVIVFLSFFIRKKLLVVLYYVLSHFQSIRNVIVF